MDLVGNGFRSWSSLVMTTGGGVSVGLCSSGSVQTAFDLDWGQAEIASVGKVADAIAWVRVSSRRRRRRRRKKERTFAGGENDTHRGSEQSCERSSLLHFVAIRRKLNKGMLLFCDVSRVNNIVHNRD